jgi:5-methylcytosine-specific restriction endonuclease McrA
MLASILARAIVQGSRREDAEAAARARLPDVPMRPARGCARCGALVTGSHCPRCGPRERWRGNAHARGYTYQWAQYARDFRARFPFCGQRVDGRLHMEHSDCARAGRFILAAVVDHITPIDHGGAMWDEGNHQALCAACHRRKTANE